MKKLKMILALVLVVALFATLFAACGTSESGSTNDQGSSSNNTSNNNTSDNNDADTDADTNDGDTYDPEDVTTIYVSYLDIMGVYDESERIEAAMNEITEPEIGVHVELLYWDMGSYVTQFNLRVSGGEQLDVGNTCPMISFSKMYAATQLMDATEYLQTYAADAIEVCGDFANAYSMEGKMYGLPNYRVLSNNPYVILRKDILEACGLLEAAEECDSWSDLEAIYAGVYDYCTENNIYVVGGQKSIMFTYNAIWTGDDFSSAYALDTLGDSTYVIYAKDDKVNVTWENEDHIAMAKRVNTWNDAGYVYPDTVLGDDHTDNLYKQGLLFSYFNAGELGIEVQKEEATGYAVVCPQVAPGMISTKPLNNFGVVIPVTCEEPEAACKFINMLFTDSRISTLFAWGVEGEDYVLNDQGEACYPDGNKDNAKYHATDYMIGNQMLVPPWEGSGADFRERAEADNKSATRSAYLGMLINTDGLDTLIAGFSSIYEEYAPRLLSGNYTDELRTEMLDKMYSVGLQDYIDEVQTQLDAWIAANK